MNIFTVGDIHGETRYLDAASRFMKDADAVIIAGDIARSGDKQSGEDILSFFEGYNDNILAVHGNWDGDDIIEILDKRGYNLHGRGKILNGVGFFGVGGSGVTPMKTASEYSEEEISSFLRKGYEQIKGAERYVLISHSPPKKVRDRTFFGMRAGSSSIRKFLEEFPIDLSIVGHIHEASGVETFNSCITVNSGSFKRGKYSLIKIDDSITVKQGKVK